MDTDTINRLERFVREYQDLSRGLKILAKPFYLETKKKLKGLRINETTC